MSYAGVESEDDYQSRRHAELRRIRWEQSAEGKRELARRERADKERQLEWARSSLIQHQTAVRETRSRIRRLERELSS